MKHSTETALPASRNVMRRAPSPPANDWRSFLTATTSSGSACTRTIHASTSDWKRKMPGDCVICATGGRWPPGRRVHPGFHRQRWLDGPHPRQKNPAWRNQAANPSSPHTKSARKATMEHLRVTVEGKAYDVIVENIGDKEAGAPAAAARPTPAPDAKAAPAATPSVFTSSFVRRRQMDLTIDGKRQCVPTAQRRSPVAASQQLPPIGRHRSTRKPSAARRASRKPRSSTRRRPAARVAAAISRLGFPTPPQAAA